jgi:protein phosphatase
MPLALFGIVQSIPHPSVSCMTGKMDAHGLTDVGLKRSSNEDQFLIADLNQAMRVHRSSLSFDNEETLFGSCQGALLLVADGMGGHENGERASRLAVESLTRSVLNTMPRLFSRNPHDDDENVKESFERALEECQHRLQMEVRKHPGAGLMGTTLTAGYVHWPRVTVVHAGDSRCYLYRAGKLKQITTDHTIAERMRQEGCLDSPELARSRWAHVLWNAIGSDASRVQPEVHQLSLQLGDTLLLCTDGLVRHLEDAELSKHLDGNQTSQELCAHLIELARDRGGEDNATIVLARFIDPSPEEVAAQVQRESVDDPLETPTTTPIPVENPPEASKIGILEPAESRGFEPALQDRREQAADVLGEDGS